MRRALCPEGQGHLGGAGVLSKTPRQLLTKQRHPPPGAGVGAQTHMAAYMYIPWNPQNLARSICCGVHSESTKF